MCRSLAHGGRRCNQDHSERFNNLTDEQRKEMIEQKRNNPKRSATVTVRLTVQERGDLKIADIRERLFQPPHETEETLQQVLENSRMEIEHHHKAEYDRRVEETGDGSGRYSSNGRDATPETTQGVRVTPAEKQAIETAAEAYDLSVTEYTRRQIVGQDMRALSPFVAESRHEPRAAFLKIPLQQRIDIVQNSKRALGELDAIDATLETKREQYAEAKDREQKETIEEETRTLLTRREILLSKANAYFRQVAKTNANRFINFATTGEDRVYIMRVLSVIGATRRLVAEIKAAKQDTPEAEVQTA